MKSRKIEQKSFSQELILNFSKKNKIIPSKFHYDLNGSKYFEKITKTEEYYVTRVEKEILGKISNQINKIFGNDLTFVEFGSGSTEKIRILLNKKVKFYVPIDISFDFIKESSKKLLKSFPNLKILPTYYDYTRYIRLPKNISKSKIGFFLGSSIGNFYNGEERKFLKNAKKTLGKKNFLFVGVDLIKNVKILKKAYNDKKNFTAKFNLNLINIMNKRIQTKLKVKDFKYMATFNKKNSSMENFIKSKKDQHFFIKKNKFYLKKGDKIQTEISKKFTISKFTKLAKSSGWSVKNHWKDAKRYYAVFLLQA
tara:strand:+ start:554 stop:1483 length:930 start_codon:yes stop_codon:yes gene_type:complete